jgi:hypothetical protein
MKDTERNQKKSKTRAKERTDLVQKECTEGEKATIDNWVERSKNKPLRFKKVDRSSDKITLDAEEADTSLAVAKLMEAFGTVCPDLQKFLLNQVVVSFEGCLSSDVYNYEKVPEFSNHAMAILQGIAPRDEIEGLLAIQMIGVHNLAMQTIKRAMITDQTFEGRQANVNHTTKMLRTYIAQMEALKKYRSGGQQKVTVEHVHVNEGGQAIVGSVNRGEGGG